MHSRHLRLVALVLAFAASFASCATPTRWERDFTLALHCSTWNEEAGQKLLLSMDGLAKRGIDTLFLEVGYGYDWESHPELTFSDPLTKATATAIREKAEALGIALVPEINCVGHQSWEESTDMLLEAYPEFDETPGEYPGNEGIYCRSWCVSNDDVYPIVFDLFDELVAVFGAKGVSVGMDEVFLVGEDACPRCRGKDRGELFARAVNRLHEHLSGELGLTMYMWGDRLIDGANPDTNYDSEWETSMNGTWTAIDAIPKDIVVCDWHYAAHPSYGSIPYFIGKGFRVLGASWNDVEAARAFAERSLEFAGAASAENGFLMLGHLYTTWGEIENDRLADWPPMVETIGLFGR